MKEERSFGTAETERIEVPTSVGILRAYPDTTHGQPGIIVMLQPEGCDDEIDITTVSVNETGKMEILKRAEKDDVVILNYEDPFTPDFTHDEVIKNADIRAALKIG